MRVVAAEKINALPTYVHSALFSDAEKAALDYASELTRTRAMRPETFQRLAAHFTEEQICNIVYLVASEHYSNLTNTGLNIHSDRLCRLGKREAVFHAEAQRNKAV